MINIIFKGVFVMRDIKLIQSPLNYSFILKLFSPSIPNESFARREILYTNDLITDYNYFFQIPINISENCPLNYIYDANLSYCKPCDVGYYFMGNNCLQCPHFAAKCSENNVIPKSGYYLQKLDDNLIILECSPNRESCL